jgi:GntR family transcriptional regulator
VPDTSDSRPPYLAVADRLRERIASGEFAPGSQLPAGRELAVEYDVAPNTVLSAIRELRDEGLVISQQGRGTFVRDGASEQLQKGGSPEFRMLNDKLDAIASAIESLTGRVRELEEAAHETHFGGPGASSPAAGPASTT